MITGAPTSSTRRVPSRAALIAYLPVVAVLTVWRPALAGAGSGVALAAIWGGFLIFMTLRALVLGYRARQDTWLVTGLR